MLHKQFNFIFQSKMAYQIALPVDLNYQASQMNSRLSRINQKSKTADVAQSISVIRTKQIPLIEGLRFQAPELPQSYQLPDLHKIAHNQGKGNAFTPAPPVIRSQKQKANAKMVKKFRNNFQYIWVLVTESNHEANQKFGQLYKNQRLENVNLNLENMLAPEDYQRAIIFPKEGLSIKLMFDYYSYQNFIKRQLQMFEKDPKVLQIYAQKEPNSGVGIPTRNKIKNIESLVKFIQNEVKLDVENSRKDKPYFNFIHSNSAPQLFSRRGIIKNCLSNKTKEEFILNNKDLVAMLIKHNVEQKSKRDQEAAKDKANSQTQYEKSRQKFEKWQGIIIDFEQNFAQFVQNHYPLEKQDDYVKRDVFNWIIIQYCIESPIYPVVNNTMRFSVNNQSVRPVSTYIKYLYDALRFYFTTRYREITYNVVYRGARVSLEEQASFGKQGRYLWNLGFMSTSRQQSVAEEFRRRGQNNPTANKKQFILIIIKLPSLTNELDHLWNQEGFFSIDKIPEIKNKIIGHEEEVLFNPLNVFKIQKWDESHGVLQLQYAPQLQILQKKRQRKKLTTQEEDFLINIARLKDAEFDKGQQHLQEGDPGAAVKYYELSDQTGSNLSFFQRSNYIKGLRQIGNAQKMETILKNSLQEEKSAERQLEASTMASSTFDQLETSIQTLTLFQQTTDFIGADEKVEQVSLQSLKKSIETPTQQALLLQAQIYIKRAKAKFGIGETFESIKQSIRSLKIIDEMANVNFCYRLWQLGNQFKSITRVKLNQQMKNLMYLYKDKKFLPMNVQEQKDKLLKKFAEIRQWDIKEDQIQIDTQQKSQSKRSHKKAQKLLQQYFKKRDNRTDMQQFQYVFVKAYWQTDLIKINREGISQKQQIQIRQQLKVYQQQMFEVKNNYKELFQHQNAAYEVLYRNIYKTSIDVSACLESYNNNLFRRWEDYTRIQVQFQNQSIDSAEVYWKHAEILYQYGQIIERPSKPNLQGITDAERLGDVKRHQTEEVIRKLEGSQSRSQKTDSAYTYHKSQLNRTISRYFRSKVLQREQSRKLSLISNRSYKQQSLSSTQASQKSQYFKSLVDILLQNNQLSESDASINKSLYKVKNTCDLIQSMNQSSSIVESDRSYLERLKSCKKYFHDVISTINKYKEKQIMERNINMAHLYMLMSQNQFRLGLVTPAKVYLGQANACLRKSMKIDDQKYREKTRVNKEKLLLGNNTYLGCLRLEAHIVAYFGDIDEKRRTLQNLLQKKQIMFSTMNQPLGEADINQSIGLMMINLLTLHKQPNFTYQKSKKPYVDAIKIREILLGPYNRFNARNYTQIVNLIADPDVRQKNQKSLKEYYKKAETIYDRIDLSLDSTLIMHKMQLKSTFLIFTNKYPEACQQILQDLQQFNQCPNKKMTLESARQLYRCSKFLLQEKKYQKQGIYWLKSTYKYVLGLEQFINKTYPMQDTDQRKFYILKLKYDILGAIVKGEYRIFNKEVDERYYNKFMEVKEKYEQVVEARNNLAS